MANDSNPRSADSAFDAIVIGTGMGAGAAGYALAKAGMRVLFLERGLARSDWNPEYADDYAERYVVPGDVPRDQVYARRRVDFPGQRRRQPVADRRRLRAQDRRTVRSRTMA